MAAANDPGGNTTSANDPVNTLAAGCRYPAIAAVTGSSSTPTIRAPTGADPMNTPAPQPGSSTGPPTNPNRDSVCHITPAIAGSV